MTFKKPISGVRPERVDGALKRVLHATLSPFLREEDGAMTYLSVVAALIMIAFGGLGIDMIHAELKRTKIQAVLDRAVLAAADLDQVLSPSEVVNDYFAKMGLEDTLAEVTVSTGLNFKRVTADASTSLDSNFSFILGVDHYDVAGYSTAEEWVNNVEVSLVLDISGSMANNSKLENLKDAADVFVDTVIDDDYLDQIAISLVPYSEHVNAGPDLTDFLSVNWMHNYSHCIEFPDSELSSTALNYSITYSQMQHFQWNYYGQNDLDDTVCPRYSYERINPFQNNRDELKAQIAQFQARAGTSIFLGMKWGVALLDPSTQNIMTSMIASGDASSGLVGRPFSYDYDDSTKHIVLMTDGQNSSSSRIQTSRYNSTSEYTRYANNNLWYYLVNNVNSNQRSNYYTERYNDDYGDALLDDICDAAKAAGITVWGIGFETEDHGSEVMQQCASSAAHYFDAEGTELTDVFYSIARSINQLRLTQ